MQDLHSAVAMTNPASRVPKPSYPRTKRQCHGAPPQGWSSPQKPKTSFARHVSSILRGRPVGFNRSQRISPPFLYGHLSVTCTARVTPRSSRSLLVKYQSIVRCKPSMNLPSVPTRGAGGPASCPGLAAASHFQRILLDKCPRDRGDDSLVLLAAFTVHREVPIRGSFTRHSRQYAARVILPMSLADRRVLFARSPA